jgi:Secretion system C-terminal sorting domain
MRFLSNLFVLFLVASISFNGQAQTRYLDEVFSNVTVDNDIIYGANATILFYAVAGEALKQPLAMDVYKPDGDTETNRPLVLFFHTGNFLPFYHPSTQAPFANGSCGGTKRDSSSVEICTRLAKMGYVVASCDYRLGWDPTNTSELARRETLINAAWRGVQDANTAIRYFRMFTATQSNAYGIDTNKIVLWGQGTGGYLTINTNSLDAYIKVPTASDNKFMKPHPTEPNTFIPMIIEQFNGNVEGTSWGVAPNNDTLCYVNHAGYSSDFALAVNMAGAVGDSSWVDPGQAPTISFQTTTDQYAPYAEGIVVVPGVNFNVVEAQGAYIISDMHDSFGNNDIFSSQPVFDLYGDNQAASFAASPAGLQEERSALYPFNVTVPTNTAPWEWTYVDPGLGCNINKGTALPYIDTIIGFYAPRACLALALEDCVNQLVSSNDMINKESLGLNVAPNPASTEAVVTVNEGQIIRHVRVIDVTGRIVAQSYDINNNRVTIKREDLPAGTYFVQLRFDNGHVTAPVQFR